MSCFISLNIAGVFHVAGELAKLKCLILCTARLDTQLVFLLFSLLLMVSCES